MFLAAIILMIPYFAIMLCSAFALTGVRSFRKGKSSGTLISVIIACRDEEHTITALLDTLLQQDHPREKTDIIIVDDNSVDGTFAAAQSYEGKLPLRVIKNNGSGKKQAILTGVNACRGEIIITTDADCVPGSRWISIIASFMDAHSPDLIIGPVRVSEKEGFFGRFQELEFLSLQGITAATALAGCPVICNGANLAFTKEAYFGNYSNLRFDIPTGDDVFLLHSMKATRSKIRWIESSDAIVATRPQPGLISFFRQRKRWASKASAYRDTFSIVIGIVTFVTIMLQAFLTFASLSGGVFLKALIVVLVLKSIPDFIILSNTTKRYGRKKLLRWFLPSQLIYPFYVIGVVVVALFGNSPPRSPSPAAQGEGRG